jgi:aromatic ring-opening dioxygenase catalytic subunit (LigB family)
MEESIMRRLALTTSVVLILVSGSPVGRLDVLAAQSQTPAPQPNMQGMMKAHEQMMANMKAAEATLDALVKTMNEASGNAKTAAIAAVVTEMVRQQKAMHAHMNEMHQQMMGMGGMMMKK